MPLVLSQVDHVFQVILEGGFFFGHVQEVDYENNTAVVYVQELGQK